MPAADRDPQRGPSARVDRRLTWNDRLMGYAFELDESVRDAAVRVIREQLDEAIGDLTQLVDDDPAEAVHDCRKCCKKMRAVARLVRPALGDDYDTVNELVRDAANELSSLRDSTAMAATFESKLDELLDPDDEALRETYSQIAGVLAARRAAAEAELGSDHAAVRQALGELRRLVELLDGLRFDDDGWDAIGDGLGRTYRRGRTALRRVSESPIPENFHEWRKRTKYTRHHVELLSLSAPAILVPLEEAMHDLSDLLGDAHDLAEISMLLRADDPVFERIDDIDRIVMIVDGAREAHERDAIELGRTLYAESPKRFTHRLEAYWDAAR